MKICIILFYISLWVSIAYSANSLLNNLSLETSKDIIISSNVTNRKYHFKQSSLCDSVVQYSGTIDVTSTTQYFFWFFESRTNPSTAPLTLWLNGGPGCSSLFGLWKGVGPCKLNEDTTKVIYNQRGSWNRASNMLFIDQPAGAGFSVGDWITTTDEAAPLMYKFLLQFFDAFPQYKNNPFHFFGESFAGHFIPPMADYILKENKKLSPENQYKYINLQSIGIGNGYTNMMVQFQYAEKMACHSTYGSVLDQKNCNIMKKNIPICVQQMERCKKTETVKDCVSASEYCVENVEKIYQRSGKQNFDVRATEKYNFTYPDFVNQTEFKKLVGIPSKRPFIRCNFDVKRAFYATGDYVRDVSPSVANLLNNGVRSIIYAGDADFKANWYGNHAWTQQLDFKNNAIYQSDQLHPLTNQNGEEIGEFQSGGGLTFVRIYKAGHSVPVDQPEALYEMFFKHINSKFPQ
ncbi:Alpha/Beta hydrolase protein [Cunninghamella echinulata]|nr:Alpha/Beta hydrolase protein [Cunninghamella echinulata]